MLSSSSRGLCLSCLKHSLWLSADRSQPWNPPGYFPPTQSCASSHPLFLSHCFRSSWGSSQPLSVDVFSFCFALIILEEVGGAGGKEASRLLEFFQIGSSSLIFQCYFPPLKLLGSLLPWKKRNPLFSNKGICVCQGSSFLLQIPYLILQKNTVSKLLEVLQWNTGLMLPANIHAIM